MKYPHCDYCDEEMETGKPCNNCEQDDHVEKDGYPNHCKCCHVRLDDEGCRIKAVPQEEVDEALASIMDSLRRAQ